MKKAKKLTALMTAVALILSLCNVSVLAAGTDFSSLATPNVTEPANMSLTATAIGDSVNQTYGGDKENVNDGNYTTRWQSNETGNSGNNSGNDAWIGVMFTSATTVNKLVITWETARATEDGYRIEYSNSSDPSAEDAVWETADFTLVGGRQESTNSSGTSIWVDTVNLNQAVSALAFRVYCFKAYHNGKGYNEYSSVFELETYNTNLVEYDVSELEAVVTKLDRAFANVSDGIYSADAWAAYKAARNDADIVINACKDKYIDSTSGYPDQPTVDSYIAEIEEALYAPIPNLIGNGTQSSANLLSNGLMYYNCELSSYTSNINYRSITDGLYSDGGNVFQPSTSVSTGASVYIGLVEPADMNQVVIYAEDPAYGMTVEYTQDSVTGLVDATAYEALSWQKAGSVTAGIGDKPYVYTLDFEMVTAVTAIRITCDKPDGEKYFKLYEVEAYCMDAALNNTVTYSSADNTQLGTSDFFVATSLKAEHLKENQYIKATWTVIRANTTNPEDEYNEMATGTVNITTAYSEIQLGTDDGVISVNASTLGADAGSSVVGLWIQGVKRDLDGNFNVEVTFEIVTAE